MDYFSLLRNVVKGSSRLIRIDKLKLKYKKYNFYRKYQKSNWEVATEIKTTLLFKFIFKFLTSLVPDLNPNHIV